PLHRQHDVIAAGITGNHAHLGAEHAVHDAWKLIRVGAAAGGAHSNLLGQEIVELGNARALPGDAHAHLVVGAPDPGELRAIKLRPGLTEHRIERGTAAKSAKYCSVLRCHTKEPIREPQAACPLHVLGHHRRIAGNEFSNVTCEHARIKVV